MSTDNLDRASMEDFRNMAAALADAEARLAAVEALVDEATGYSVPYKRSRFMPIDSAFTNALRAAVRADPPEAHPR